MSAVGKRVPHGPLMEMGHRECGSAGPPGTCHSFRALYFSEDNPASHSSEKGNSLAARPDFPIAQPLEGLTHRIPHIL